MRKINYLIRVDNNRKHTELHKQKKAYFEHSLVSNIGYNNKSNIIERII